jgi:ribosomal protein L16 Arg81 hydroxylase
MSGWLFCRRNDTVRDPPSYCRQTAMTVSPFNLESLLSPIQTGDFFSGYWERQPLFVRRQQPNFYERLMPASDLEGIISDSDGRYPAIRLAKGGAYFAPEVYTHTVKHGDESFVGIPDVKKISEEYRRGATIALPVIHRRWKALGVLCDQLQAGLDHPVHANVYITPGNAEGFTPHYDVHEVFVLQIAGKKRWSIYAPVIELPHRSQRFTPQAYSGQAPIKEIEMSAGDLLYLPRGFLHSTTTSDSFSAHVTIGITVFTWADLLKDYVQNAIVDTEQRRALPPGFASRSDLNTSLKEKLIQALHRLQETTDVDELIESFRSRVRAAHVPRPPRSKPTSWSLRLTRSSSPRPPNDISSSTKAGRHS